MSEEKERASKMFWVIHNDELRKRRGYECPDNPDCWWFPDVGYTLTEGYHIFNTKERARSKLLEELKTRRDDVNQKIAELGGG